jgi:hypothetical protein
MKVTDIKKELELLNEMAVTKVDFHFHNNVLEDILECGQVEYLIDNVSWVLYWADVSEKINYLMNSLIVGYQNGHKSYYPYLMECTRIKSIIDKKLIDNPAYNEVEVKELLGFDVNRNQHDNHLNVLGQNENRLIIIDKLHKLLINSGLIDIELSDFLSHFKVHSQPLAKIKWLGTEIQIVGMFTKLIEKAIFPNSYHYNYHKLITIHFINKYAKEFKVKQLAVTKTKITHLFLDEKIVNIVNALPINRN